jgi:hypothetical protein
MTHDEAVTCRDSSHLDPATKNKHRSGEHCAPCCDSLRVYGKVLDAVAIQHQLEYLRANKAIQEKAIARSRIRKDMKMVAILSEDVVKIDKEIANLEAALGKAEKASSNA